jgi:hypothetical protein
MMCWHDDCLGNMRWLLTMFALGDQVTAPTNDAAETFQNDVVVIASLPGGGR